MKSTSDNDEMFATIRLEKEYKLEGSPCSFVFFKPYDVLAVASYTGQGNEDKIYLYKFEDSDREKLSMIHTITKHKKFTQLMKWNEKTFISYSDDQYMCAFEIEPPFNMVKDFQPMNEAVFSTVKVTDDLFVAVKMSQVDLYSFSKGSMVRTITSNLSVLNPIARKSKTRKTHIFLNTTDRNFPVFLLNTEKHAAEAEVNRFFGHSNEIYHLETFVNSKKEEIMLSGGDESFICVHNTSLPKGEKSKIKKIEIPVKSGSSRLGTRGTHAILNFCGYFMFVLMSRDDEVSCEIGEKIHFFSTRSNPVLDEVKINFMSKEANVCLYSEVISKYSNGFYMFSSFTKVSEKDGKYYLGLFRTDGLFVGTGIDSMEVSDQKERIEYLMTEVESFFFENSQQNMIDLRIGTSIPKFSVLRILLL